MKKTVICFLTALMLLGTTTIFADSNTTDAGTVKFTGNSMDSSFSSAKLAAAVGSMQPGDDVTFVVQLSNPSSDTTDWYMSNEVLQSLEDTQEVAENGGYTYVLKYFNKEGKETVLYDSSTVGGEKDRTENEKEGLNEATDSLDEFFFLDRLTQGDSGKVTLLVKLDGESQGNIYQDTLAKLMMNFAVEKVANTVIPSEEVVTNVTTIPEPGTPMTPSDNTQTIYRTTYVETGDIWMGGTFLMFAAGIGCVVAAVIVMKKKGAKA